MPEDKPLKSAYELAMERLLERDRRAGVDQPHPLTDAQKRKIAELRQVAQAKLAEIEILHRDRVAAAQGDPDKLRELDEHLEIDKRRVSSDLESSIAEVKRGAAGD